VAREQPDPPLVRHDPGFQPARHAPRGKT
jgi:hypothetical protein